MSTLETIHAAVDALPGGGRCPDCGGTGKQTAHYGPDDDYDAIDCPMCKGSGRSPAYARLQEALLLAVAALEVMQTALDADPLDAEASHAVLIRIEEMLR